MRGARLWMGVLSSVLGACGGEPVDADPHPDTGLQEPPVVDLPDPADVRLAGPCPMESHLGGFTISANAGSTVVSGSVEDRVLPLSIQEVVATRGDCRLLRRVIPHCEPACDPSKTCDHEGRCVPWPVQQDLGTVRVHGLGAPVAMEPWKPGFSYHALDLPHPAFEADAPILLQTEGGALDPFELYGVGVGPLELLDEQWVLREDADTTVRWNPLGGLGRSHVAVLLRIDLHGISPAELECTFSDTGEGTLPGALVARLVELGVSGYPQVSIRRRTMDSAAVSTGCVSLEVVWSGTPPVVDVEGYEPCSTLDPDCPEGQNCNFDLEICE